MTNVVSMINHRRKGVPIIKESVRPFRLWNPKTSSQVPHRCYSDERRAQDKALSIARWDLKVGESLEVIDVRGGKLLGVYTRRVHTIDFHGGK